MSKYLLSILMMICVHVAARGVEVYSSAGRLESVMASDPSQIDRLVIKGSIDASDMVFIQSQMTSLRELDLSEVSIEAYHGDRLLGLSNHAANVIPAHVFAGSKIEKVNLPKNESVAICDAAFAGAALMSVDIGSNISITGIGCFAGCQELAEVVIDAPASGIGTFAGCSKLNRVVVGSSYTTIFDDYCFSDCGALCAISGSENVKSIGTRTFANCTSLKKFKFGSHLTSIGCEAFMNAGLTDVDLEPSVVLESIGDWAFAQMPSLTTIRFGSARDIGCGVLFECRQLLHIETSSTSDLLPNYAYTNDSNLDQTGILGDNVTAIGRYALSGLSQITSISVPGNVEYIDDNAMERMSSLRSMNVETAVVPELGNDVWAEVDCANVQLFVPKEAVDMYRTADQWKEFNISDYSDADDDVIHDLDELHLWARFDGFNLVVYANNSDVRRLSLYDESGKSLATALPNGEFTIFDVSGYSSSIFIIRADLIDGRSASLKISKH